MEFRRHRKNSNYNIQTELILWINNQTGNKVGASGIRGDLLLLHSFGSAIKSCLFETRAFISEDLPELHSGLFKCPWMQSSGFCLLVSLSLTGVFKLVFLFFLVMSGPLGFLLFLLCPFSGTCASKQSAAALYSEASRRKLLCPLVFSLVLQG